VAIGPVQLLVLGFSHPDFHGEVIADAESLDARAVVQPGESTAGDRLAPI